MENLSTLTDRSDIRRKLRKLEGELNDIIADASEFDDLLDNSFVMKLEQVLESLTETTGSLKIVGG